MSGYLHHPPPVTSSDPILPPESPPNTLQAPSTLGLRLSSSSSRTHFPRDKDADQDSATLIEETTRRSGEGEGAEDESEVERYGADEPKDPEEEAWNVYKQRKGRDHGMEGRVSAEEEETECGPGWEQEKDHNLVGWDGPDDPENPQNWSKTYKCFVTGICAIITFNVYVPLSPYPSHLSYNYSCR